MRKVVYQLRAAKRVSRFLAKLDTKTRTRLIVAVEGLQQFPPVGDIKPLKGRKGLYRLRFGDIRVIFSIDHKERVVYIADIGHRGDIYK